MITRCFHDHVSCIYKKLRYIKYMYSINVRFKDKAEVFISFTKKLIYNKYFLLSFYFSENTQKLSACSACRSNMNLHNVLVSG